MEEYLFFIVHISNIAVSQSLPIIKFSPVKIDFPRPPNKPIDALLFTSSDECRVSIIEEKLPPSLLAAFNREIASDVISISSTGITTPNCPGCLGSLRNNPFSGSVIVPNTPSYAKIYALILIRS